MKLKWFATFAKSPYPLGCSWTFQLAMVSRQNLPLLCSGDWLAARRCPNGLRCRFAHGSKVSNTNAHRWSYVCTVYVYVHFLCSYILRSIYLRILYYIILYYIILYYIILYYTILYYILLYSILLYYIIFYYILFYSIILYYMQYIMYIHVPDGFHSLRYMVLITAACSQRATFHAVQVPDLVRGAVISSSLLQDVAWHWCCEL